MWQVLELCPSIHRGFFFLRLRKCYWTSNLGKSQKLRGKGQFCSAQNFVFCLICPLRASWSTVPLHAFSLVLSFCLPFGHYLALSCSDSNSSSYAPACTCGPISCKATYVWSEGKLGNSLPQSRIKYDSHLSFCPLLTAPHFWAINSLPSIIPKDVSNPRVGLYWAVASGS